MSDEIESLRAEVAALRAELAEGRAGREQAITRRRLLTGLAGLGAAGAVGVADAPAAGAATGEQVLLGQTNTADAATVVVRAGSDSDEVEIGAGTRAAFTAVAGTDGESGLFGGAAAGGIAGVEGHSALSGTRGVLGFGYGPTSIAVAAYNAAGGPALASQSDADGVTLFLAPAERIGPPTTMPPGGAVYEAGCISIDSAGETWLCVATGAPGTWTRLLREDTTHGRTIPITPFRAIDTRATGGRAAGAPVVPGQRKGPLRGGESVTLDLGGVGPIPATATGVIGNATVILPTASGYLRILPAGASVPAASFNFAKGTTEANGFTSALPAAGIRATAPISSSITYHLVIDIAAYIT